MSKEEYMTELKTKLEGFDEELVQEITADYEERFKCGLEGGKSEEEVARELGSVDELVKELNSFKEDKEDSCKDRKSEKSSFNEQKFKEDASEAYDEVMGVLGKVFKSVKTGLNEVMKSVEGAFSKRDSDSTSYEEYNATNEMDYGMPVSRNYTATHDVSDLNIIVNGSSADVDLLMCDTEKIAFNVDYGAHRDEMLYPFYINDTDSRVEFRIIKREGNSAFFARCSSTSIKVTVSVPRSFSGRIRISTASGDIKVQDLNNDATELYIDSLSGDLEVYNCNLSLLKTSETSGDLHLGGGLVKKIDISTVSGDVSTDVPANEYSIKTTSGDVDINNTAPVEFERSYCVRTTSGDAHIKVCGDANVDYSSISGDLSLRLDKTKIYHKIHVDTVSGDREINVLNKPAGDGGKEKCINTKTVSGDIFINLI
ncbi:MAG: DUF4097 family beta strand repeat-containing protein [Lachnospiraceae bacterium]|nr:DUF4097 family beta strand repeat-containing protein [Lachnospiraceae bacterium]